MKLFTRRKTLALAVIAVAWSVSFVAWADGAAVLRLDSVTLESRHASGNAVEITPLEGAFTLQQGAAQTEEGLELYHLDLGSSRYSDSMTVQFLITNPHEMRKAFGNPNAFLSVSLWYKNATGEHTLSDDTQVSQDPAAVAHLNKENAYALLIPETHGVEEYWLLASFTVPGGAPPGGQQQAAGLGFWVGVQPL